MRARLRCSMLAVLAVFTSAARSEGEPSARFMFSEVRDSLAADAVVGARRSGMLCTPAGRLAWRAVAPERRALVRDLAVAARGSGLSVKVPNADDFDEEVRSPFRIAVTIEAAHLNACVPWMGIRVGRQSRQRVSGEIDSVWRVFDQRRRVLIAKFSFCTKLKHESASADLSQAVAATLVTLVPGVARRLQASEPLEAAAEQAAQTASGECIANEA